MNEMGKTNRGFSIIYFKDGNDKECQLQCSSAIGDYEDSFGRPGTSFVWLGLENADPKILSEKGWVSYPIHKDVLLNTRMHLNREQVENLIDRLNEWLEKGKWENNNG